MSCNHGNSDFSFDPCEECAEEKAEWDRAYQKGRASVFTELREKGTCVEAELTAKLEAAEKEVAQRRLAANMKAECIRAQATKIEALEKDAAKMHELVEAAAEEWARYVEVDTAPYTLVEHMRTAMLGDSHG